MRRTFAIICGLLILCCNNAAWAHHDAAELGHHWEVQSYASEMHVQMAGMLAIAILVIGLRRIRSGKGK